MIKKYGNGIYLNCIILPIILLIAQDLFSQKHILGAEKEGLCSFYSGRFDGLKTSSGQIYRKHDYTAAHKNLPFNTILAVFNLKTKAFVIVRVNDHGPYSKNRLIDISSAAAHDLGIIQEGVAKVKIRILGFNNFQNLDAIDPFGNEAELLNDSQ